MNIQPKCLLAGLALSLKPRGMTPEDEIAAFRAENARLYEQVEALGALAQELQARLGEGQPQQRQTAVELRTGLQDNEPAHAQRQKVGRTAGVSG
jgi:hypothetical protein